jgi:tetratricopeptide (TPR) repeat protein
MKALEKEPDRRYSSASALAEDIGRWLANQPILARPPTMMYQIRKLVARHRVSSALAAAMLVLIIGFGAAMSLLYAQAMTNLTRAQQAEQTAADEARRAREEAMVALQIKDFLVGVFKVSSPEVARGRTVTARELLDAAAKRVDRNLDRQPAVQATIMHTIGQVYDSLGLYEEAAKLLQQALVKRQELEPQSLNVAETASTLGTTLRKKGELDGARRAYETALAIMKKRDAGGDDVHVLVLLQSLADVLAAEGDVVSAEATLRELLGDLRRSTHGRSGLPSCLNALAGLIADRGAHAEAVPLMREAVQIATEDGTCEQSTLMSLRGNLAWLLALSGQDDEAEKIIQKELVERRRILPPKHPAIATSLITMGVIDMHRGESSLAEPLFREAVGIREAALGANHSDAVEARGFLGECLTNLKRFDEAQRLLLASWESMRGTGFQPVGFPAATAFGRKEAAQRLMRLFELRGDSEQAAQWRSVADGIVVPGGASASDRDNAGLGRPSEK